MNHSQALVPEYLNARANQVLSTSAAIIIGFGLLVMCGRIAITLPFTPVPITGQTFGVALISLLWGKVRGISIVGIYLALGIMGLPVFALGKSGLIFGPTTGYLIGMLVASYVMGLLADKGWTDSFLKIYLATLIGSVLTFTFGVSVLSFFIPKESLFLAGILPFIPGDFLKSILVSFAIQKIKKLLPKKECL